MLPCLLQTGRKCVLIPHEFNICALRIVYAVAFKYSSGTRHCCRLGNGFADQAHGFDQLKGWCGVARRVGFERAFCHSASASGPVMPAPTEHWIGQRLPYGSMIGVARVFNVRMATFIRICNRLGSLASR